MQAGILKNNGIIDKSALKFQEVLYGHRGRPFDHSVPVQRINTENKKNRLKIEVKFM